MRNFGLWTQEIDKTKKEKKIKENSRLYLIKSVHEQ